jgi:hypothetical protein
MGTPLVCRATAALPCDLPEKCKHSAQCNNTKQKVRVSAHVQFNASPLASLKQTAVAVVCTVCVAEAAATKMLLRCTEEIVQ